MSNVPSVNFSKNELCVRKNPLFHSTWIEIDLRQFRKNIEIIQSQLHGRKYCLPIKANAYGHGLVEMGLEAERCGVDTLGVSSLLEGVLLREAKVKVPILVFGAFQQEQIQFLIDYQLDCSISSLYKAELVHEKLKEMNKKARVHLKVETGMNRTGARVETAHLIYDFLKKSPYLEIVGVYSHLANSDISSHPLNQKQKKLFEQFIKSCSSEILVHLENSGALLSGLQDSYSMVRPGLLSFGISTQPLKGAFEGLASCFSLKSRISYFKVVEKGQGISYGSTHTTSKRTRIATVPIGYGDGYRRSLSNRAEVLIRGKRFPIVGTICMDQLMVDLQEQEAYVGDEVVLIGKQGTEEISLQEIAALLKTIPYEVLCSFNERIQRFYIH